MWIKQPAKPSSVRQVIKPASLAISMNLAASKELREGVIRTFMMALVPLMSGMVMSIHQEVSIHYYEASNSAVAMPFKALFLGN